MFLNKVIFFRDAEVSASHFVSAYLFLRQKYNRLVKIDILPIQTIASC